MPSTPRKIALFGGTFDPVHNGHLFIAERATRSCHLDEVVFLPCWQSPHKQDREISPAHDRLAMLDLALVGRSNLALSTWEIDRSAPSYSWITATHFAESHPDADLHWLLGTDQWAVIETWARPDVLAELLTFIVFPRNGIEPEEKPGFRSVAIDAATPESGTAVRSAVSNGQAVDKLVPPPVLEYIRQHGLYT